MIVQFGKGREHLMATHNHNNSSEAGNNTLAAEAVAPWYTLTTRRKQKAGNGFQSTRRLSNLMTAPTGKERK